MARLSTMAPELVPLINEASEDKRQSVKLAACLFVMPLLTEVDRELLKDVSSLLLSGEPGSAPLLEKLEALAWSFDEKYLPMKERREYLKYFVHARGLTGLMLALKTNSVDSVCDCFYEIAHAADDKQPLFLKFVQTLLD